MTTKVILIVNWYASQCYIFVCEKRFFCLNQMVLLCLMY